MKVSGHDARVPLVVGPGLVWISLPAIHRLDEDAIVPVRVERLRYAAGTVVGVSYRISSSVFPVGMSPVSLEAVWQSAKRLDVSSSGSGFGMLRVLIPDSVALSIAVADLRRRLGRVAASLNADFCQAVAGGTVECDDGDVLASSAIGSCNLPQ